MSIILKGIDLPEGETIVIHYANRYGEMETVYVDESDIIQISKGHGRLIDADELVKHLRKDPLFDLVERYGISGVIESRPTILVAEEQNENTISLRSGTM